MALTGSYIDVAAADAYAAAELDSAIWTALSAAQKTAALIQATEELDAVRYQGIKYDADQERAFPRAHDLTAGSGDTSPAAGAVWDWDSDANEAVVPANVKRATYLQAVSIAEGGRAARLDDSHDGIVSGYGGGIGESRGDGKMPAPILCRRAHMILRRYYLRSARMT